MLLGEGDEGPKHRGEFSQGRPKRRGTRSAQAVRSTRDSASAEDGGGTREGSVAPSLDGTGAGSPPDQCEKSPSGIRVRPKGRSTSGPQGAKAVPRREPSEQRAWSHATVKPGCPRMSEPG